MLIQFSMRTGAGKASVLTWRGAWPETHLLPTFRYKGGRVQEVSHAVYHRILSHWQWMALTNTAVSITESEVAQ